MHRENLEYLRRLKPEERMLLGAVLMLAEASNDPHVSAQAIGERAIERYKDVVSLYEERAAFSSPSASPSPVSRPIQARSDLEALLKLLREAGGQ